MIFDLIYATFIGAAVVSVSVVGLRLFGQFCAAFGQAYAFPPVPMEFQKGDDGWIMQALYGTFVVIVILALLSSFAGIGLLLTL